jgi:hypothetical protein
MKRLVVLASVALLLAFVASGCQKTTEPGGPGAQGGTTVDAAKAFELKVPDGTNVKQGEQVETTTTLSPGSEFNQEVVVTFTAPAGVTIEPAELKLTKDNAEAKIMIKADATAAEGDHTITVHGKPATGETVDDTFKVTVGKGDAAAVDTLPPDGDLDLPPAGDNPPPVQPDGA